MCVCVCVSVCLCVCVCVCVRIDKVEDTCLLAGKVSLVNLRLACVVDLSACDTTTNRPRHSGGGFTVWRVVVTDTAAYGSDSLPYAAV